jgi:hypothetical protein
MLFAATTARKGTIEIGTRKYDAVLAQRYIITGRFDRPHTALLLTAVGSPNEREHWWGADELCAMRSVDDKYYCTSTTPTGDRLFVKQYDGEFGLFRIGPGGRDIEKPGVSGSLRSETAALALGKPDEGTAWSLKPTDECRLPVGDYMPNYITVEYGRLRIGISNNYHSDGRPRDYQAKAPVFGIKIRKNEPYVFDFSHEPEVMFASPAKDQTFKLDSEINVKAVLTDPVLDIMIRDLDDTTRTKTETHDFGDGKETTTTRSLPLDPTVTITDSSGKRVAEGTMPFG